MDWSLPAWLLERRLRAFWPWPGSYTRWRGQQLQILEGVVLEVGQGQPGIRGQVVVRQAGEEPRLVVVTGEGLLGLVRLQLEGRKPQSAEEFVRGYREFAGSRLPC